MDNQNDIALANTVNGGGLRVGETNVGAFVGSTLVAGKEFDWSKLYSNLNYIAPNYTGQNFLLVIANFSSYNVNLHRLTEDAVPSDTTIEVGKIDWFSIGYWANDAAMAIHNYSVEGIEGNPALKYVRFLCHRYDRDNDNYFAVTHGTIDYTDYIEQDNQSLGYETLQHADVIFIFDN
jgi:hypothetical protein